MKAVLSVAIALFSTAALAQNPSTNLKGVDRSGHECSIQISNQADGANLSVHVGGYQFHNLILKQNEDGSSTFNETTMAHSKHVYARVIGSPITVGNIGLLKVTGKVLANQGNIESVRVKAVGSLLNWWRETFECKNLQQISAQ